MYFDILRKENHNSKIFYRMGMVFSIHNMCNNRRFLTKNVEANALKDVIDTC